MLHRVFFLAGRDMHLQEIGYIQLKMGIRGNEMGPADPVTAGPVSTVWHLKASMSSQYNLSTHASNRAVLTSQLDWSGGHHWSGQVDPSERRYRIVPSTNGVQFKARHELKYERNTNKGTHLPSYTEWLFCDNWHMPLKWLRKYNLVYISL